LATGWREKFVRATLILLAIALAGYQLATALEPIGHETHNWRQSDVYSVAYNFHETGLDFFHPRIDFWRGPTGIVGMEAPVYPALVHFAMYIFGEHARAARLVGVLAFLAAVIIAGRKLLPKDKLREATFYAAALLSPMALQEFRQIQADGLCCALTLISAALIARSAQPEGRRREFALGIAVYTLAVITKTPAITAGPALFLLSWSAKRPPLKNVILRGLAFAIPLAAGVAWTAWAGHLTKTYEVLSAYFHLDFTVAEVKGNLENKNMWFHTLGFLVGGFGINWVLIPSFLAGLVLGQRKSERALGAPMLVWFLCAFVFCLAFSFRTTVHSYYALVLFAPCTYFAALGLANLAKNEGTTLERAAALFVFLCLIASPVLAAQTLGYGPTGGGNSWLHTWFLPRGAILGTCAFVIAVVVAARVSWRPRPWANDAAVAVAVVWGAGWALPSEIGYVWFMTGHKDGLVLSDPDRTLRETVAAHTTRDDIFIVDGYNPWFLHRASRRGFAGAPDSNVGDMACKTPTGIAYYLHYTENGRINFPGRRTEVLGQTPEFELYKLVPPLSGNCINQPSLLSLIQEAPPFDDDRVVHLVSDYSKKCMTATSSIGAEVKQFPCTKEDPHQRFRVTQVNGATVIKAADSDFCISALPTLGQIDQPLKMAPCSPTEKTQPVQIKVANAGTYFLARKGTEKVWDGTPSTGDGQRVNQFNYHGGACQQWRFEAQLAAQ